MIRIYEYPSDNNQNLPEEDVWMEEDHVVSSMEYTKKWNEEHGLPDEYNPENNRNFEIYECHPNVREVSYLRVRFERRCRMKYHEARSVEQWLKDNPHEEVVYEWGVLFHKTWVD